MASVCDVHCNFVTFPFGILGQVWYLIVSIPDSCCLSDLYYDTFFEYSARNKPATVRRVYSNTAESRELLEISDFLVDSDKDRAVKVLTKV